MVVKCFNCETLLRVNRDRIPEGEQVSVRCPKCGSEGPIRASENPKDPKADFFQETESLEAREVETQANMEKTQISPRTTTPVKAGELTLPEDAFKNFRFPAEIGASGKNASSWNHRGKLIIFVMVSILVVALFATLVNIILPG